MLWSVLAAVALTGSPAHAESGQPDVRRTFDAAAIKRLALTNGNGAVHILGSDSRTATVDAHKGKFGPGCRLSIGLKDGTLTVVNKEAETDAGHSCEVSLTLAVPRQLAVDLQVGAGDVTLAGLKGDLSYKLGSGDLVIKDADLGDLAGRSGTGNVEVTGFLAAADLKLGAGNADITLSKAPAKGHLDVKVGTGSATIRLPKDSRIKSSFKAGLGSLTNEFKNDDSAGFAITGSTGTGDMNIKRM